MTQPSLKEQQLAELDELLELARVAEQKLKEVNEESEKVAQKWQRRAEDKRAAAQKRTANLNPLLPGSLA